jgi:hypothetical protein
MVTNGKRQALEQGSLHPRDFADLVGFTRESALACPSLVVFGLLVCQFVPLGARFNSGTSGPFLPFVQVCPRLSLFHSSFAPISARQHTKKAPKRSVGHADLRLRVTALSTAENPLWCSSPHVLGF